MGKKYEKGSLQYLLKKCKQAMAGFYNNEFDGDILRRHGNSLEAIMEYVKKDDVLKNMMVEAICGIEEHGNATEKRVLKLEGQVKDLQEQIRILAGGKVKEEPGSKLEKPADLAAMNEIGKKAMSNRNNTLSINMNFNH